MVKVRRCPNKEENDMFLYCLPIAYLAQAANAFAPPAYTEQAPTICAGAGQSENSSFAKPTTGLTPAAYALPLRLVAKESEGDPFFPYDLGMFRPLRELLGMATPRRGRDR